MRMLVLFRCLLKGLGGIVVWAAVGLPMEAQAARAMGNATTPTTSTVRASPVSFDVVSIRPASEADVRTATYGVDATSYFSIGEPLWITMMKAYFPPAYWDRDRIVGLPKWVLDEPYTIRAKVPTEYLATWRLESENWSSLAEHPLLQEMLQNALKERCGLAVRRVPGTLVGYAMVVDKGGLNRAALRASEADEKIPSSAVAIAEGASMMAMSADTNHEAGLRFFQTSMHALAAQLSNYGSFVVDQTGVDGRYDFFLRKLNDSDDADGNWDVRSLGLKLTRASLPVDRLEVEHIERPSPN